MGTVHKVRLIKLPQTCWKGRAREGCIIHRGSEAPHSNALVVTMLCCTSSPLPLSSRLQGHACKWTFVSPFHLINRIAGLVSAASVPKF